MEYMPPLGDVSVYPLIPALSLPEKPSLREFVSLLIDVSILVLLEFVVLYMLAVT